LTSIRVTFAVLSWAFRTAASRRGPFAVYQGPSESSFGRFEEKQFRWAETFTIFKV
jgi:hypothetical protein